MQDLATAVCEGGAPAGRRGRQLGDGDVAGVGGRVRDGDVVRETSYTPEAVGAMERILRAEAPDVLLAHWPIDTHMDHQVAGMLALQGLRAAGLTTPLFYYEVRPGEQTLSFRPTHYVDVTPTREKKRAALLLHRSQPVATVYRDHHAPLEVFRGREAGIAAAEAFCAVAWAGGGGLPGLP